MNFHDKGLLQVILCSAVLASCAQTPTRPPAAGGAARAVAGSPGEPAARTEEYLVGPGDVLRVVVAQNPELNAEVPVRPDGKISTPLASDIDAVGRTPTQLSHDIEAVLGKFIRTPNVSVIVTNAVGTFGQVRVMGRGVTSPKGFPFRAGMTVLDLVQQVGGLSQFAAGNRAKIIRTDKQGTHEIKVRLDDLLNKGKVAQNLVLQPGDILVIPESLF